MHRISLLFCSAALLTGCHPHLPAFLPTEVPPAPDYGHPATWAALPDRTDPADEVPVDTLQDRQAQASVDVFFLHPTLYTRKRDRPWNASVSDERLNRAVDETTILYQASAFNGTGRIFAPRYRQAHLRSFYTADKSSARQALDLAYEDVRAAFQQYLAVHNQGRPILIAAHSQGSLHAYRLLDEFFDGKPLQRRLVAAYLVGWPVFRNGFSDIPPCESDVQTGCFCSWRSFRHGHFPKDALLGDSILVTNPLTWTTGPAPASDSLNRGTLLRRFDRLLPGIADARVVNGVLWVHKPQFPGSIFFIRRNYHIADYNLFYLNIRENARLRADSFWK
ncbi:MAG: hypothetical protein RLY31_1960 [Bacteroidota bacterium]|jgi:hypothetical protein